MMEAPWISFTCVGGSSHKYVTRSFSPIPFTAQNFFILLVPPRNTGRTDFIVARVQVGKLRLREVVALPGLSANSLLCTLPVSTDGSP